MFITVIVTCMCIYVYMYTASSGETPYKVHFCVIRVPWAHRCDQGDLTINRFTAVRLIDRIVLRVEAGDDVQEAGADVARQRRVDEQLDSLFQYLGDTQRLLHVLKHKNHLPIKPYNNRCHYRHHHLWATVCKTVRLCYRTVSVCPVLSCLSCL